MKILRLHVENFGTLQNFDLSLADGLNVLYQKNGWGKSTLAVFIKAMFYGLPATAKRSLDENERKKYAPWQGGAFGGSLEFSCGKGSYRIERFFGTKEAADSFALYDLATNKPSTVFSAAVGEELFGIDADGFERSTYLSQRALVSGKENNSISAKLGGALDEVGDIGSFDVAMEALEKRRRHYVMTGNRGAIAEMEQARMEKQTDLERCVRVREAMEAQEAELATCNAQIREARVHSEQVRANMKKAGLARERAALIEHKNEMQNEIASLQTRKKELDRFFEKGVPSAEELAENRNTYEKIKETSVRLEMIPKESPDLAVLRHLRSRYRSESEVQTVERLARENDLLRELQIRRDTLRDTLKNEAPAPTHPLPSIGELEKAKGGLEQIKKLEQSLQQTASVQPPKPSRLLPFAHLAAAIGGLLLVLAIFPALQSIRLFMLIGAGLALAASGILYGKAIRYNRRQRAKFDQMQRKRQEWNSRVNALWDAVYGFLQKYEVPQEELPSTALASLELRAEQVRKANAKRQRLREELAMFDHKRESLIERMQGEFQALGITLPIKQDYRAEVDRIRQELAQLARLEQAETERLQERASTQEMLENLKEQLLPFLRRFDPVGKLRAGDCLDLVGEHLAAYKALVRSITQKEAQLREFIVQKKLDMDERAVRADEMERWSAEERAAAETLEKLQRQRTLLKSSIDRLAADADRIPELEEELLQMKQRIDEARANAATVAHTAKLLEEAKNALSTRYLDGMQTSFASFLSTLIGEHAPDARMDTSFDVRLREGGQTHTMESFSRGWRDAVQFCVRLSLTDALYQESELPFLLLDDPFVNLDDERLTAARALLESLADRYQILYLVCHRERV